MKVSSPQFVPRAHGVVLVARNNLERLHTPTSSNHGVERRLCLVENAGATQVINVGDVVVIGVGYEAHAKHLNDVSSHAFASAVVEEKNIAAGDGK
jgi:aspartate 1-decarboxylase